MIIDLLVTLLNALLDYLLIFGVMGCPRMGIVGAGLATSISLVVKLILMLIAAGWLRWEQLAAPNATNVGCAPAIGLFSVPWAIEWPLMARLVRYGWPAAISSMAESVSFSIIIIMVGRIGAMETAATTLALGVNMIAFIPMFGLGMAVGVLVGQRLAAGAIPLARRTVRSGLWIAIGYSTIFVIGYGLFPDQVLSVYSFGTEPERFAEMKPLVLPLLRFIAIYCVFDAVQIVFVGVLKGAGDTTYVLLGSILSGVTTVTLGKLIGDQIGGGLYWWWGVITVWVILLALLFGGRYLHGGWQSKRVIEPELL